MKKLLALTLVLVLVVGIFASCDTSTAPVDTTSKTENVTDSPSTDKPNADSPASGGEVVIKWPSIWVGSDSKAAAVASIVEEFNTLHAGEIKVVVEEMSDYQAYRDKIRTSITAGTAPDFFTVDYEKSFILNSDKLVSLDEYLDEEFLGNFKPGFVQKGANDAGTTVLLPYEIATIPIFYNQQIFTYAGVDALPITFEEQLAAAEKIKTAGKVPYCQMTGENAWTSMIWFSYLLAAHGGEDVMNNMDDPAWVAATTDLLKTFGDNTSLDAVGAGAAVSGGHYLNGESAMFTNGTWYFPRLSNDGIDGLSDNTVLSPGFAVEGGKAEEGYMIGSVQAFFALGDNGDQQKIDASIEFLKFMYKPENINKIAADSGALFSVDTGYKPEDKLSQDIYSLLADAPYVVDHFNATQAPGAIQAFPQELDSLVLGEKTPEEFVEALKAVS